VAVHAVVLAAGKGRRFGNPKLHALFRGRPLLAYVLDVVESARKRGILTDGCVVLGADDGQTRSLTEAADLTSIVNDAPQLGLGHSLRLAISYLQSVTDLPAAALIFLGDQPLVRFDVVDALIKAWREQRVRLVRPRYEGSPLIPGHPVLLDSSIWPMAADLSGDAGFGSLLGPADPHAVSIDVPGDNPDIDTIADLKALEETLP
jgi:molybdenum cofactor cytidylyltransferase